MNIKTKLASTCCALVLTVLSATGTVLAAGPLPLAGVVPSEPDWVGKIDSVNSANNSIIVNDRVFILQSNTLFHGNRAGRSNLRAGMTISIKSVLGPGEVPIATEIWMQ